MKGVEIEVFKALYIACIAVGIFIFALLLSSRHRHHSGNKTLAVFMLLIQIPALSAYSQLAFGRPPFFLLAASQCLILVYGPMVYFLLKAILAPKHPVKLAYLHFLPFLLVFTLKLAFIPSYGPFILVLFGGLVVSYLVLNMHVLFKERSQFMASHSQYKNTTFYWFSFIVAGLGAVTVFDIMVISLYLNGIYLAPIWWYTMTLGSCGYLTMVVAFSIWRPTVFFNELPEVKTKLIKKSNSDNLLEKSVADALEDQLKILLKRSELFKDNELTLWKLAKSIGVSTHVLSELLNVHMNTSFYELLNQYRLESAMAMLQDSAPSKSIIDIAFSAGFNNKNTFYRVFKEKVGVTPSSYRNSQRKIAEKTVNQSFPI